MATPYVDPYAVLGVTRSATPAEIRQAYFALVRAHPPEREPETFKRIRAAYERLRDPERRTETDMLLLTAWPAPARQRRAPQLDLALHAEDVLTAARAQRPGAPRLARALRESTAVSECSRDTHAGSPFLRRLRWTRGTADRDRGAGEGQEKALTPIVERLEAIERQLEELARLKPSQDTAAESVQQTLAALEKQISRAGREQFKAHALAEAQMEQLGAALEMLRAADARREAEVAASSARSRDEQAAARLDVVQAMIPALDGLDEALRSGRRLLEQHAEPPRPATLLGRLRARVRALRRSAGAASDPRVDALREAMAAWLVGLTFVRQRLLDVLAVEGVQPIAAQGAVFDPHYHVAVEVVPSDEMVPPSTVAYELRRGYMVGERVLRYAEVAVAAQTEQETSRAAL